VPIISLDPGGYIKMWNPAAEQVFGWTTGETLGRAFR
jgi:PAS domain S-box-containing protein